MLNEQQMQAFKKAAEPLMTFLKGMHPHMKVVVDSENAELLEGVATHGLDRGYTSVPAQPGQLNPF